ncbi:hypothetical protein [Mesomycoplasma hyorhinis]|uniref:hypothetical protein n=1 Tax=Mesomycoplasma hyorhinis TaxID=2100 RepID=UPI001C050486|nr:hypothetical protein [Mesomycoplasma hyorhinis]
MNFKNIVILKDSEGTFFRAESSDFNSKYGLETFWCFSGKYIQKLFYNYNNNNLNDLEKENVKNIINKKGVYIYYIGNEVYVGTGDFYSNITSHKKIQVEKAFFVVASGTDEDRFNNHARSYVSFLLINRFKELIKNSKCDNRNQCRLLNERNDITFDLSLNQKRDLQIIYQHIVELDSLYNLNLFSVCFLLNSEFKQNNYINEEKNAYIEQQRPATDKIISNSFQGNIKQRDFVTPRQTYEEKIKKEEWLTQYLKDRPNIILKYDNMGRPIIQITKYIDKNNFEAIVKKDSLIWDISKRDLSEEKRRNIQDKRNEFSKEHNVNMSTDKLENDVPIKNKSLNYIIEVFYGQNASKYDLKTSDGTSLNKLYEKYLEKNQNTEEKEEKNITEKTIETQNNYINESKNTYNGQQIPTPDKSISNSFQGNIKQQDFVAPRPSYEEKLKKEEWLTQYLQNNPNIILSCHKGSPIIQITNYINEDNFEAIVKKDTRISDLSKRRLSNKDKRNIQAQRYEFSVEYNVDLSTYKLEKNVPIKNKSLNSIIYVFYGQRFNKYELKTLDGTSLNKLYEKYLEDNQNIEEKEEKIEKNNNEFLNTSVDTPLNEELWLEKFFKHNREVIWNLDKKVFIKIEEYKKDSTKNQIWIRPGTYIYDLSESLNYEEKQRILQQRQQENLISKSTIYQPKLINSYNSSSIENVIKLICGSSKSIFDFQDSCNKTLKEHYNEYRQEFFSKPLLQNSVSIFLNKCSTNDDSHQQNVITSSKNLQKNEDDLEDNIDIFAQNDTHLLNTYASKIYRLIDLYVKENGELNIYRQDLFSYFEMSIQETEYIVKKGSDICPIKVSTQQLNEWINKFRNRYFSERKLIGVEKLNYDAPFPKYVNLRTLVASFLGRSEKIYLKLKVKDSDIKLADFLTYWVSKKFGTRIPVDINALSEHSFEHLEDTISRSKKLTFETKKRKLSNSNKLDLFLEENKNIYLFYRKNSLKIAIEIENEIIIVKADSYVFPLKPYCSDIIKSNRLRYNLVSHTEIKSDISFPKNKSLYEVFGTFFGYGANIYKLLRNKSGYTLEEILQQWWKQREK